MGIAIANLAEAVRDVYTSEVVSTERMWRAVAAAARFYSTYNPYVVVSQLSIVSGQLAYVLPEECMQLVEVDYFPGGTPWGSNDYLISQLQPAPFTVDSHITAAMYMLERNDQALRIIRSAQRAARIEHAQGAWEYKNRMLWLTPAPAMDQTVLYVYIAAHVTAGAEYTTIPNSDFDIMRDLTVAELLTRWQNDFSTEPDYQEGLEKLTKHFLPDTLSKRIRELRQPLLDRYGRDICVMS